MKVPGKWRETIDPFLIEFNSFKLIKVLGYPPAKNDVFYVKGIYKGKRIYAYIKHTRNKDNNFIKEINFLKNRKIPNRVELLDYDKEGNYIVTRAKRAKILSKILKENKELDSLEFLQIYGEKLAQIHKLNINCERASDRKFSCDVEEEYALKYGLEEFRKYLIEHRPSSVNECFCHGDMHYGNVLWKDKKIVAILDYEYAGVGNKEYDIAWCIIRRPTNDLFKNESEVNTFLNGYRKYNDFDINYVKYYMGLIYMRFYKIGIENKEYREYVYNWLKKYCGQ